MDQIDVAWIFLLRSPRQEHNIDKKNLLYQVYAARHIVNNFTCSLSSATTIVLRATFRLIEF